MIPNAARFGPSSGENSSGRRRSLSTTAPKPLDMFPSAPRALEKPAPTTAPKIRRAKPRTKSE